MRKWLKLKLVGTDAVQYMARMMRMIPSRLFCWCAVYACAGALWVTSCGGDECCSRAALQFGDIPLFLEIYRVKMGGYPETLGELCLSQGTYSTPLPRVPMDCWGHPFVYHKSGVDEYILLSLGRDGMPGGVGEDKDMNCLLVGQSPLEIRAMVESAEAPENK